jgi:type IV secretion system protein VirB5
MPKRSSNPKTGLGLAVVLSLTGGGAQAQQIVYDPSAYGKLLEQAQTELRQLDELKAQVSEARRLYDGFNRASGVNGLAPLLSNPAVRGVLPDAAAYETAAKGDLAALGRIGAQAAQIRRANRLFTPPADDPQGQALERAGDRAARDLALGAAAADAGAQRLVGLQQLQVALDAAPDARAVMDLQARLAAEQAMIANDQMRMQGLAMAQAAEARLARQRELERVAAENAARLKLYRGSFP